MKRKKLTWLAGFLLLAQFATGQDLDHLMVRRQLDCPDVSGNCALLFEQYIQDGKTDSAGILLKYWENKCGLREPVKRARILLSLKTGTYHDSLMKPGMISAIINYQERRENMKTNELYQYDSYRPYFGFVPVGREFDQFTIRLASEMERQYLPGTMEHLLCMLYSSEPDSIFKDIQSSAYENSWLYQEYFRAVDRFLDYPEFHISWITGAWLPTGGISRLGTHPELGFQMGVKKKKWNYDLVMCFKFGNSAQPYYARRVKTNDSLVQTSHFLGGYIGFDIGYDLLVKHRHEFQALAGFGLDGFDALEKDDLRNWEAESITTYNFNFGVEHRFYFSPSFYLGLQLKYNIVDYSMGGIVDFTGNPITLRLILGGFSNPVKRKSLEKLEYPWRR
jgi:hypothetical protein